MSVYIEYPVGRCADGGCFYLEPHRHGFACDTECACRGIGAVTSPLGDDDLAECDWGYCNRPSVALRLEVDITGTEAESWLAVCSWHAGWDDYENEGGRP